MRLRQPESGANEKKRRERERSEQIRETRASFLRRVCRVLTESVRSLLGLWDPKGQDSSGSLPPPFSWPRVAGGTAFLRLGAGKHLESTPSQAPPFAASPPVSGGPGLNRSAEGEEKCSRSCGDQQQRPARQTPALGLRSHSRTWSKEAKWGSERRRQREERGCGIGPFQPLKLQSGWGGLAEPPPPPVPRQSPSSGDHPPGASHKRNLSCESCFLGFLRVSGGAV